MKAIFDDDDTKDKADTFASNEKNHEDMMEEFVEEEDEESEDWEEDEEDEESEDWEEDVEEEDEESGDWDEGEEDEDEESGDWEEGEEDEESEDWEEDVEDEESEDWDEDEEDEDEESEDWDEDEEDEDEESEDWDEDEEDEESEDWEEDEEEKDEESGDLEEDEEDEESEEDKTGEAEKAAEVDRAGKADEDGEEVGDVKTGRKKKAIMISLIVIPLLILLGIGGWYYISHQAYKVCRVEAGVAVAPSDFLKYADENASFAEDSQPFDTTEPGEYKVRIKSGLLTHNCTLIIEDTIAPSGEGRIVQIEMGGSCGAEELVSNISDATAVAITFVSEPDFTKSGEQPVQIVLEDKGGNRTIVEAGLFITQVVEVVTMEVGEEVPGLESFVIAGQDAAFITDMSEIDYTMVGEHKISVTVDGADYVSTLHIVDTIPPQAEVRDVEGYALAPRNVEEFVAAVEDATEVTAAFAAEPDLSLIGTQELEIVFTDGGGNETVKQAKLTLMEDKEAPVIKGAKDMTAYIGDGVSYRKNVSVTDNCPDGVELVVDTSAVNLDAEGVYPVTYTARDLAGNTASVTVNLTVNSRVFNPEKAYALADEALAGILKEGMTAMEKVTAIYDYVKGHVGYVSHSEKGDWLKAAYEGLSTGKGDCYTYAHTSRLLLDRAGITNMIIEKQITKETSQSRHVWNLVDIGDGWYHFDACPRRGLNEKVLMWTDERLMEYSDSHSKSHNYDRTVYTGIK